MSSNVDMSTCNHCGATLEGNSYVILFGQWDSERSGYESPPGIRPLCESCYREYYDREKGAHYEVEDDGQELWDILSASDGRLAADLMPIFVGGRPYIRVVDDELQVIGTSTERDDDGTVHVEHERREEYDREWFDDVFKGERGTPMPTIAILKPVEETPFEDVTERGEDSHKLSRWST